MGFNGGGTINQSYTYTRTSFSGVRSAPTEVCFSLGPSFTFVKRICQSLKLSIVHLCFFEDSVMVYQYAYDTRPVLTMPELFCKILVPTCQHDDCILLH